MPRVGFEPTILAFERTKTVHALDSVVTVIGSRLHTTRISTYENYICTSFVMIENISDIALQKFDLIKY
jgi:hypothetical protein